ncbi:PAS domain S-box protein [Bradyrhizobium jicamae]|uniref:PAS domain-containing protein n=1 Tax=Bradyrhizobium jicamae TaxID=280332 RepID=UPI001BAD0985|nr:PAS domain-containing protein [Bradyrhizobium jicamae]MBR0758349.1 PAS domain S-box protein [Bradyrhizobium jicamae]
MNSAEFQVQALRDVRLAGHATSPLPAWLWSVDGARILWANPAGALAFGAANGPALAAMPFGPAEPHRRQVASLARRLPLNGPARLERLRGFGAALGVLATCGCQLLEFADGSHGILVSALNAGGRSLSLAERLQLLMQGMETPAAAFTRDGLLIAASESARRLIGFHDLAEAKLDITRSDALAQGRADAWIEIGRVTLLRIGRGADIALVALIKPAPEFVARAQPAAPEPVVAEPTAAAPVAPQATPAPAAEPAPAPTVEAPIASYESPALTDEAPAEFALFDALEAADDTTQAAAPAPVHAEPEPVPATETPLVDTALVEALSFEPAAMEAADVDPQDAPEPITCEPAPEVEAVADEPEIALPEQQAPSPYAVADQPAPQSAAPDTSPAPSWLDEPLPSTRRHPLRFMWQMDHEGRFSLGTDEFTRLIGMHTAAGFGRLWTDIANSFGLDPEGRVMKAFASRDTWSGITLNWPVDGGGMLPVELSGLPILDRARNFAGYRGFGVCRDLDGLARLAALRRYEFFSGAPVPQPLSASPAQHTIETPAEPTPVETVASAPPPVEPAWPQPEALIEEPVATEAEVTETTATEPPVADAPPETIAPEPPAEFIAPVTTQTSHQADLETPVETTEPTGHDTRDDTPKNVVPFRPAGDAKAPSLTPVENNAFNELARQLSARLESETGAIKPVTDEETVEAVVEQPQPSEPPRAEEPVSHKADWLVQPEPPARGESRRDRALLDLLPVGVLIYRLDRLLYANRAFLERMGYASLHALEDAGGLDALFVEPGVSNTSSTSDTGTPVMISASQTSDDATPLSAEARLHTIAWDDDSALALIFSSTRHEDAAIAAALAAPEAAVAPPEPVTEAGHADAEELGAILDTAAEGIIMFDAEGNIQSCNRSAEALFGYDGDEFIKHNLADLFAPESQHDVFEYLASVKSSDVESLLDHGREALGRVRQGGIIPLAVIMGRTRADGPNFFAVFRDLSQAKQSESELREARRLAERAANAKSDMLARISHELRTPLNAIIGFAEVMIGERFGALGNERYVEYMKDIRASGERVISIVNDLLDLSRIETGKLDLAFTNQNLNEMVESCVAVMQPQANRERIIIRTSLAHTLPPVIADARALRQITLNLIGNSIHLANAGGQVIVSTALSDFGEVMLRVRDTGPGLNDNEVAAALEPFRTPAPSDQSGSGVSLSLTKALVEANRAKFQIKTGGRTGTLIEVTFTHAAVRV